MIWFRPKYNIYCYYANSFTSTTASIKTSRTFDKSIASSVKAKNVFKLAKCSFENMTECSSFKILHLEVSVSWFRITRFKICPVEMGKTTSHFEDVGSVYQNLQKCFWNRQSFYRFSSNLAAKNGNQVVLPRFVW